jgi:hypothetical protein
MLDHMLATRKMLAHYRGSEIHNEILHDESVAFAIDRKFPESDHAPVVATFDFPLRLHTLPISHGPIGRTLRTYAPGGPHVMAASWALNRYCAMRPCEPTRQRLPGNPWG